MHITRYNVRDVLTQNKKYIILLLSLNLAALFLSSFLNRFFYTRYSSEIYYRLYETMVAGIVYGVTKLIVITIISIAVCIVAEYLEVIDRPEIIYIVPLSTLILINCDYYLDLIDTFETNYINMVLILRFDYPRNIFLLDYAEEISSLFLALGILAMISIIFLFFITNFEIPQRRPRRRRRRGRRRRVEEEEEEGRTPMERLRERFFVSRIYFLIILIILILMIILMKLSSSIPPEFLIVMDMLGILKVGCWISFIILYSAGVLLSGVKLRIPKKVIIPFLLVAIIVFSSLLVLNYRVAKIKVDGAEKISSDIVEIKSNLSEIPIDLEDLRLIDRALAVDFAKSFKLPSPPRPYNLEILDEYAHIGYVNNKPAWVLPIRYEQRFMNKETNLLAGFVWIYLTDTPVPENIKYVFYEMDVGPALYSKRNIYQFVLGIAPEYSIGEFYVMYPDPVFNNWSWIVLLDKIRDGYYFTEKILILHSEYEYEILSIDEARSKGIPQVYSSAAMVDAIKLWGSYLRGESIDPTAQGYMWVPRSPDIIRMLNASFYSRPHHFLIGENWFGRDFYAEVTTAEGGESIVLFTMINDSITFYDLRTYEKGGLRGVSDPIEIMDLLGVRYPKLYKLQMNNTVLLLWIGLKVSSRIGPDVFDGIAFIDAANTRIKLSLIHI